MTTSERSPQHEHEVRVRQLIRRLSSVHEPIFVEKLARELLSERPVGLLAELLATLGRMALDERARTVYMGVVRLCLTEGEVPREVREEVYSMLAARGEGAYVRFLLPVPPVRTAGESDLPYDSFLDDMPLGMRKWKARCHDRNTLLRLSRDGNPSVIANLLNNPLVVEEDVVAWASRRPATREIQLMIARHRKWSLRPRVQEALARNTYTPTHVAVGFLPLFTRGLLKKIGEDGSLHEIVRDAAKDVLELRTGRR